MSAGCECDGAARQAVRRWLEAEPLWLRALAELRRHGGTVYLVGGSVRDALRGQPGEDMDLAVAGEALALGRMLGDKLRGAFYPMDREHDVARIVLAQAGRTYHIDLAGLRGGSILEDLAARDFTVNAMGMALTEPLGPLLDPTGGRNDLQRGMLRMAYPQAFRDDPVRMLRALRLGLALGLSLEPETRARILAEREQLRSVSGERVRDELMAILAFLNAGALREAAELGLLPLALALEDMGDVETGLRWLEKLHESLAGEGFGPYTARICEAWETVWVAGRRRRALVALAALVAHVPGLDPRGLGRRLRLSSRETAHLEGILESLKEGVWAAERDPGPAEAHRYYRRYGEAGVDGAVLAACRPGADARSASRSAYLLWAWYDAHDPIVAPPRLLTGEDLMRELGLEPGPAVGALLDALAEAQAAGRVANIAEARAYARELLGAESSEGNDR